MVRLSRLAANAKHGASQAMGLSVAMVSCSAAFAFHAVPAWSLTTYNLTFSSKYGGSSNSLSGSLTIDETNPAASLEVSGPLPSWFKSLSLTLTEGTSTQLFSASDFDLIIWEPASGVDFSTDLVPQFYDLNFNREESVVYTGCDSFTWCSVQDKYVLTSAIPQAPVAAPAPLPVFGALGAFAWSRRLRQRISS
jgi:hypothetical protein